MEKERLGLPNENFIASQLECGHTAQINNLIVFDNSKDQNSPQIVSCSNDKSIIIWDVLSGSIIRTIKGAHSKDITSVAMFVHPDVKQTGAFSLASCSNGKIILWDFSLNLSTRTKKSCHQVTALTVFDPKYNINNPISIVADIKGNINIWDIIKLNLLLKISDHANRINSVSVCRVHPLTSDFYLLTSDGDHYIKIRMISVIDNVIREVENMKRTLKFEALFLSLSLIAIPSNADNNIVYLVKGGTEHDPIRLWKVDDLLQLRKDIVIDEVMLPKGWKLEEEYGEDDTKIVRCITSYAFDKETKSILMVTGGYDNTAKLWRFKA